MICRNCGKELPEGSVLCCFCGTSVEEAPVQETPAAPEQPRNKPKWWVILLVAVAGLALVAVLAAAVLYGLGMDPIEMLKPKANDVTRKDSYTVEDDKAVSHTDAVVATIGDRELTNGELQIYYWETVYSFLNDNYYYLTYYGLNPELPLDEQAYPGDETKTWQQHFLENALSTWQRYTTLQLLAAENGFETDADMQEFLDGLPEMAETNAAYYGYESAQQWLEADCGPGVTLEGYYNYVRAYYEGTFYLTTRYDEMNPTDAEVEAYFQENQETFASAGVTEDSGNYYDVRHILIEIEGGTEDEEGNITYSEEDWETCRQKAQELLDQWAAGEATEESFAKLATEHSADGGSSTDGGLYTDLTESTNFVEEFKAWYLDENNQPGSTGLVKSVYGYHIMYQSAIRPIWKTVAAEELLTDRVAEMIEQGMEKYPMEVNYKKIVIGDKDIV